MKKLLSLLIALSSVSAWAAGVSETSAPRAEPTSEANIQQGDWKLGGYFDLTGSSGRFNDGTSVNTSLNAGYFIANRLSLGVSFSLSADAGEDASSMLGPAADFYFWNDGKIAAYVGGRFRVGLTDNTMPSSIGGILGAEYFIVPSVAVGPSAFVTHYNGGSEYRDFQRYGMSLGLGIYL